MFCKTKNTRKRFSQHNGLLGSLIIELPIVNNKIANVIVMICNELTPSKCNYIFFITKNVRAFTIMIHCITTQTF
jgi:hypothetical protein